MAGEAGICLPWCNATFLLRLVYVYISSRDSSSDHDQPALQRANQKLIALLKHMLVGSG